MRITRDMLIPGRVTHEDDDFITIEFGKRDDVVFNLMPNDIEGNENAEQNRFHTVIFVHALPNPPGGWETWRPWEHYNED
jgi:uncharacterized membrane protein